MRLPTSEARAALLRCLEFYGAARLDEARWRIPLGLGEAAHTKEIVASEVPLETLERAAAACISAVQCRPKDEGGAAPNNSTGEVALPREQVALAQRFLSNCPPFETRERDAMAVVVLLLWSFPESHEVALPLTTEQWEGLLTRLRQETDDAADCERVQGGVVARMIRELEELVSPARLSTLMAQARLLA